LTKIGVPALFSEGEETLTEIGRRFEGLSRYSVKRQIWVEAKTALIRAGRPEIAASFPDPTSDLASQRDCDDEGGRLAAKLLRCFPTELCYGAWL
jgi:hypothetical protein